MRFTEDLEKTGIKHLQLTDSAPMWETVLKKVLQDWKEGSDYLFPKHNMWDLVIPEKNWHLCDDPLALFIAQSQTRCEQINAGFIDHHEGNPENDDPSEGKHGAPQCDICLGWCEGIGWFVMLSMFPLGNTFLYTEHPLTEDWGTNTKNTMMGTVEAPSLIPKLDKDPDEEMDEMIDGLLEGG